MNNSYRALDHLSATSGLRGLDLALEEKVCVRLLLTEGAADLASASLPHS